MIPLVYYLSTWYNLKMKYLTPAEYVVHVFGGYQKVATAINTERSVVHHWVTRKRGRVPLKNFNVILTYCAAHSLDITQNDLIQGRMVKME